MAVIKDDIIFSKEKQINELNIIIISLLYMHFKM